MTIRASLIDGDQFVTAAPFERENSPSREFLRASGLLAQYDLVETLVRYYQMEDAPRFQFNPEHVLELHRRAYFGLTSEPGKYRSVAVQVGGHSPPPAADITDEVEALCEHVNAQITVEEALPVAAYVLWRLNWIHPFKDGNGTTARAAAYLILSIGLKLDLPGTPTIPEQIRNNRQEYYSALAHADATYQRGAPDLEPLTLMLHRMLYVQLSGMAALSGFEQEKLDRILELRVRRSPPDVRIRLFGGTDVRMRLWTYGDHITVHIGPEADMSSAEQRNRNSGDAFPKLFSTSDELIPQVVVNADDPVILKNRTFDTSESPVLMLHRNASAVLSQPTVEWQEGTDSKSWSVQGSLYVFRLGHEVSGDRLADTLEPLLVRQIAEALRDAA